MKPKKPKKPTTMTTTTNTSVATTFPCSTLPPVPKPNDIASSGSFIKEAMKTVFRWWAKNGLFFAKADAHTFIPAGIKAIRDAATELEAEFSSSIP
jgi:hypothetical protein